MCQTHQWALADPGNEQFGKPILGFLAFFPSYAAITFSLVLPKQALGKEGCDGEHDGISAHKGKPEGMSKEVLVKVSLLP